MEAASRQFYEQDCGSCPKGSQVSGNFALRAR